MWICEGVDHEHLELRGRADTVTFVFGLELPKSDSSNTKSVIGQRILPAAEKASLNTSFTLEDPHRSQPCDKYSLIKRCAFFYHPNLLHTPRSWEVTSHDRRFLRYRFQREVFAGFDVPDRMPCAEGVEFPLGCGEWWMKGEVG